MAQEYGRYDGYGGYGGRGGHGAAPALGLGAHSLAHSHGLGHGISLQARLAMYRAGLWLFLLSESMIFLLLLVVRFVLAGRGHPAELNQPLAVVMTAVLLLSGWPARRAVTAIAQGDQAGMLRNLWLTIGLGTLFLVGMAYEWSALEVSPRSLYGTVFFTTTGFHGLHLLVGILFLLSLILQGRQGAFAPEWHWGVEAGERYWHFVDLVWVFVYLTLYLL